MANLPQFVQISTRTLFTRGSLLRAPPRFFRQPPPPRSSRLFNSTPSSSQQSNANAQALFAQALRAESERRKIAMRSTAYYVASAIIFMSGLTYAAVPAYKVFCAVTGIDGTPVIKEVDYSNLKPVEGAHPIRIHFNSDVSAQLGWKFTPQTNQLFVVPGETALAFYTATNYSDDDVVGVSTYSVVPAKAAQYFNKIQCFCFEEQKLLAKETVDMPVFFYIDPEFADDPWMNDVTDISGLDGTGSP